MIAYAATLVDATRKPAEHGLAALAGAIAFGASPRASINLVRGARALAFLRGRDVRAAAATSPTSRPTCCATAWS